MTGMNFARMIVLIQTLRLGSVASWEVATVLTSLIRASQHSIPSTFEAYSFCRSIREQMDGDVF